MTPHEQYDAIIVGAGAAGLSCALGLIREWEGKRSSQAKPPRLLVISKLQPLRSHTGSAEGGIAASLANVEEDDWTWHYRDTIKGGDWLVDQDAARILAQEAPQAVISLEHDGVAFSRTEQGRIDQRRFGGHTGPGGRPVRRVAFAADRIGHEILTSLWQQCQRYPVDFADEWYVTDLVLTEGRDQVLGVIALDEGSGQLHALAAPHVVLATGGAGRLYHTTSNSWDLTGDGLGLALAAGLQLEDMEFVQFHPTGLGHTGILLSEAARGEGGVLRNAKLEAFMEDYAPGTADLAARDVVSRAIQTEIAQGRGIADTTGSGGLGGSSAEERRDCVWLDLRAIGPDRLAQALPEVCGTIRQFAGLDPASDLIPVRPTAHYTMGGIPIGLDGTVYRRDGRTGRRQTVNGLKAAGECSCVSVHGANRLGANSLLDAIVFGTRAGQAIAQALSHGSDDIRSSRLDAVLRRRTDRFARQLTATAHHQTGRTSDDNPYRLMSDLGLMMESHLAISCEQASIGQAITLLERQFIPRAQALRTHDATPAFNQEACAIMEADNLTQVALALARASLARKESRGCLSRRDYPTRDDQHFLAHSFTDAQGTVGYQPVRILDYPPQERSY